MANSFQSKVRTAAVTTWWTLLFAVGLTIVQGVVLLIMLRSRPAWVTSLWGGTITWDTLQNLVLWMIAIFRVLIWLMLMVAFWLSIWAVKLRRAQT